MIDFRNTLHPIASTSTTSFVTVPRMAIMTAILYNISFKIVKIYFSKLPNLCLKKDSLSAEGSVTQRSNRGALEKLFTLDISCSFKSILKNIL